jgi:pSer/pThr/pTyr-binding forkhead associated (FHA) protein
MNRPEIKVTLTVVEGKDAGASFELKEERTVLGRAKADIRLTDPKVSQLHAALDISGQELFVTDMGSRNGLFVNGEKVEKARLRNLDEVRIGFTKFTVLIVEDLEAFMRRNVLKPPDEPTPMESPRDIGEMIEEELRQFSRWDLSASADEVVEAEEETLAQPFGLEVLEGPDAGRKIRVQRRVTTLGRGKADVVFHDADVSRLHASIEVTSQGEVRIRDLGSTNGIHVNARKVKEATLAPEDRIQIGSTHLRFVAPEPDEPQK